MATTQNPQIGHLSLFGGMAPEVLPAIEAPRASAPAKAAPVRQVALDLFADAGLFEEVPADELEDAPAACEHAASEVWCNSTDCACECAYCMASAERYLLAEVEYDRPIDEQADELAADGALFAAPAAPVLDVLELEAPAATPAARPVRRAPSGRLALDLGTPGDLFDVDELHAQVADELAAAADELEDAGALPLELPAAPAAPRPAPAFGVHAVLELVAADRFRRAAGAIHRRGLQGWTADELARVALVRVDVRASSAEPFVTGAAEAADAAALYALERGELITWGTATYLDNQAGRRFGWAPRLTDAGQNVLARWSAVVVTRG